MGFFDAESVKSRLISDYILAHLVMLLLLEPLVDALEDSPRGAYAA
jgi:hypothetical protein